MIIFKSIKPKATVPADLNIWPDIIVREMAEAMRDMDAAGIPVTIENLKRRNYDCEDVMRYGLDAANLARKLSVKAVM